jgi:histidinol-phosphate phosphatase family protein|tara:strand:- start:98 stop:1363 length:1266 start_codon:yes stop_codon:yes gene_type:complete
MEIAILIGGSATRLKKILRNKPKAFLKIGNKPIIVHQIEKLSAINKKIFILSKIKYKKFNNILKKKFKRLKFIFLEESSPLGTAGCLKNLEKFNFENFLIIYGDLIFNIDLRKFIKFHLQKKSHLSFLVHPSDHPSDSDIVEVDKDFKIIKLHKNPHKKENIGNLCISGISIINKEILKYLKPNKFQDFSKDVLEKLLKTNLKIYAYNTREYVKDAGTLDRINLIKKQIRTKIYTNGNLSKKMPAIFLDRDGVINEDNLKKQYQNPLKLNYGAVKAVKLINDNGYLSVIVTNQAAVAKGFITLEKLENDHKKLEYLFGKNNAYFDRIYYCPYYPHKGFKGENIKFKKRSSWRKPNNGMFLRAIKDLNINKKNSYMIGDRDVDYLAAKKTGIKCLIVGKKFVKKGLRNYKNLHSATRSIFKS